MTKQCVMIAGRRRVLGLLSLLLSSLGAAQPPIGPTDELVTRFARYGADVWAANPTAKVAGEGSACVSCHTSLPYALVEPLLPGEYLAYTDLVDNIDNRILTWSENTAWYADEKLRMMRGLTNAPPSTPPSPPQNSLQGSPVGPGSRGVEAIFNALIRATHDAYTGVPAQPETRLAFQHMWSEQVQSGPKAGRWNWIQVNLIPWEVADSDLWGAALACVAADLYDELAPPHNLQLLHTALRQGSESDDVSLHAKAAVLWCDSETGGKVLEADSAASIAAALVASQRPNGGWALRDLGPWVGWAGSDRDCCAQLEVREDAYATGFVTLALARRSTLVSGELTEPLQQAVAWIDGELANPYPAEPRYNRHASSDHIVPHFRNNLSTNAGHMWALLARTAYQRQAAPWRTQ